MDGNCDWGPLDEAGRGKEGRHQNAMQRWGGVDRRKGNERMRTMTSHRQTDEVIFGALVLTFPYAN